MANGQSAKFGEAGHYRRLEDDKGDQSYAKQRYADEVNRIYGVMNNRLYDRPYIAGDEYTIADMICYPWCTYLEAQGEILMILNTLSGGGTSYLSVQG